MPYTVLLADPDAESRSEWAHGIRFRNYDVVEAASGPEALLQFSRLRSKGITPVLVINKNMPEMDGLEVVAAIRKEYGANPPIIMRTDFPLPKEPEELGIDTLLGQIPRVAELRNEIADLAEGGRATFVRAFEQIPGTGRTGR